ncbi:Transcription and mRNA export factor SUS1 [Rhynchospora pubera]|uniref:Transcription and mRNA export factor ENY2 n=1 Tax=Rhynchospora pubera TaxID=906938 RepID=A0AAV8C2C7_9POAL|nr:Transcription and mRNA export factor SUS1 [Rhynchospora pubera]
MAVKKKIKKLSLCCGLVGFVECLAPEELNRSPKHLPSNSHLFSSFTFFSLLPYCIYLLFLPTSKENPSKLIARVLLEVIMRGSINRPPTPDGDEEPQKEPSLREIINIKLIESGEKEKLMELLRQRLIECGWRDDMKSLCRAYAKKKGRNNVTVDELIHIITPKGRASVPDSVKAELLQRIRSFLMSSSLW